MERRAPCLLNRCMQHPQLRWHVQIIGRANMPSEPVTITARLGAAVTFPATLPIDQPWTHQPLPKAVEKRSQRFFLILVLWLASQS